MPAGQKSSSALDAIHYLRTDSASDGCQPHEDKGILTCISADISGLQVRNVVSQIAVWCQATE